MNGNEDKELTGEDALRAKLCAVILGEASDVERAEVEAALANSAELRAERARLEATIGLVSTALKDDGGATNELSPQAQAALSAAVAKRARPVAWHRTNGFRIAASFALFVGVVSIWRASVPSDARPTGSLSSKSIDGLVASAPAKEIELGGKAAEPTPVGLLDDGEKSRGERDALEDATRAKSEQPPADANAPATQMHFGVEPQQKNDLAKKPGEVTGSDFFALDTSVAQSGDAGVSKDQLVRQIDEVQAQLDLATAQSQTPSPLNRFDGGATPLGGTLSPNPTPEALTTQPAGASGGTAIGVGAVGHAGARSGGGNFSAQAGKKVVDSSGKGAPASGGATPALSVPAEKRADLKTRFASGQTLGPPLPGQLPAGLKSEGKAKDFGEVRKGLEQLGYASGDDKDGASLDAFEVPLYRDENGRTIAPDWRTRFDYMQRTCWPQPNEKPRDMFFRYWGDNPFEITAFDKLSTFSVDVDTASYTLARKYLVDGQLPTKEQVRTEEFVNYFKGDVPAPREGTFNVATELAPSLFGDSADEWMMRVALRGREVQKNERMPLTLTFIIDVSGSMRENDRLELVKHALRLLVAQLDARDSISLVKFSNDASLILPMTSAKQRDLIESAINPLQPEGSTNTEAGLRMGYAQAVAALSQGSNNRVVLLTDGVANVGITDPNALVAMVENQRKTGIYLNTVGVGMNNHNDNLLEQLADKGDGVCNYVDDAKEVRRALVDNFTGAFETIARDVKIQVEFDPTQVERYRLLGYENRAIADADFRNDKVDAGEVGAGHQVVALYEIVRTHVSGDGPLATVHVRWKQPYKNGVADGTSDVATEIAQPVFSKSAAGSFNATSSGYRRAVLVAQFAEFLRRSIHARNDSVDRLVDESRKLASELKDPDFNEFVAMVDKSRALVLAEIVRRDWFDRCGDELRRRCYLQAQIDDLQRRLNREPRLDELQRDTYDLQRQLDALRTHLESLQGQGDEDTLRRLQAENIDLQRRMLELLSKDRISDGK